MGQLCLPKVELMTFDGTTTEYWKFIKQFEYYVEAKVVDYGQRLLYLMYYCRGRAREAIEGCMMLPPSRAYVRARGILKELFGQPYRVAHSMIDSMLNEARNVTNTAKSLSRLAIRMENCSITLRQMDYVSDLDSMQTLERIVKCLPINYQFKWAEEVDRIALEGREPSFDDLSAYIRQRSRIACNRFGQLAEKTLQSNRQLPKFPVRERAVDLNRVVNLTARAERIDMGDCKLCGSRHAMGECPKFLSLEVSARWETVRRFGRCFRCLGHSHIASDCKANVKCDVDGCIGRHHPLLHLTKKTSVEPNDDTSNVCATASSTPRSVRLGIVPVKVETPRGLMETLAVLDSGSDTTLIRSDFAERCGIRGSPSELTVSTLTDVRTSECLKVNLVIRAVDGGEAIEIDEAFTVHSLPVEAPGSTLKEARKWAHLSDIPFADSQCS